MKRIPTFVAGMLTAAVIGGLGVGALAASGQLTISVDPVNIQVNGETFQPKDANGKDVPVFAYQGTTYAPLRALAEAYGLEVGYDAVAKMATVGKLNPEPVKSNRDPETIATYIKCNAVQIGDKIYQLPIYGLSGVNVDENGQIYVREHIMDVLNFTLTLVDGTYEIIDGDNPKADGRISFTDFSKVVESRETVYLSASEEAEDYRITYNEKTIVSPASPNYVDGKDNLGIRKVYAYGSVTPIGWWFNLNDVLSYFGLNYTLSVDAEKNLLILETVG